MQCRSLQTARVLSTTYILIISPISQFNYILFDYTIVGDIKKILEMDKDFYGRLLPVKMLDCVQNNVMARRSARPCAETHIAYIAKQRRLRTDRRYGQQHRPGESLVYYWIQIAVQPASCC